MLGKAFDVTDRWCNQNKHDGLKVAVSINFIYTKGKVTLKLFFETFHTIYCFNELKNQIFYSSHGSSTATWLYLPQHDFLNE
jgi:hypothetical protein